MRKNGSGGLGYEGSIRGGVVGEVESQWYEHAAALNVKLSK